MTWLWNFLKNELFYWFLSACGILILVLIYGVLFDKWYKDWDTILIAGSSLYLLTVVLRFFAWIGRKSSRKKDTAGR